MAPTLPLTTPTTTDFRDPFTQAAHIEAAAALIERDGLHHGDFYRGSGDGADYQPGTPVCMFAALALVTGATDPITSEIPPPLLRELLVALGFVTELQAYAWADARTGHEVAMRLRGVAGTIRRRAVRTRHASMPAREGAGDQA